MTVEFSQANKYSRTELDELNRAVNLIRIRVESHIAPSLSNWAEEQYLQRRHRNAIFAEDTQLFGEPAWDILLDLLVAHQSGKPISVSSACIAADVPSSTALRYITRLEARGLVRRHRDTLDGRRHYLELTDRALGLLLLVSGSIP